MVLAKLPAASVAVQVIVDSPSGKTVGASFVIVTKLTVSTACGATNEISFSKDEVASARIHSGSSIVGGVVSIIVIVCVEFTELPDISTAVQVTFV